MDPLSQGLTGAVLAQSAAKPKEVRLALLAGMAGGMLADLDVLIASGSDPLLNLDFHRHFTHALIFIPIGGLIAALLLWPFLRRKLSWLRLLLFTTLGYATAGLLDACTSYGTHLLWPFSEQRTAWNIISIIDPIYTSLLLIGVLLAARHWRTQYARFALVLGLCYLALGFVQRERVQAIMQTVAAERGDVITRSEVKPTMGNLLLWRGIYQSGDRYSVDAYRVSLLADEMIYTGETRVAFDIDKEFPQLDRQSVLANDIRRFAHFSDGYLVRDPSSLSVIGDLRYAMLPTSGKPLWGIVMEPDQPNQHVRFENFRDLSAVDRQRLIAMLFGESLPQ